MQNAQPSSDVSIWRDLFAKWPRAFPRKGVVIAAFDDPVPFCDFVFNADFVVLERATPDVHGARRVVLPFSLIQAVKYLTPLKTEQFLECGYVGALPQAQPTMQPAMAK